MTLGYLAVPLQLRAVIGFLQSYMSGGQPPEPLTYGWLIAASYVFSMGMVAFGTMRMMTSAAHLSTVVRAVLAEAIYRKTVR